MILPTHSLTDRTEYGCFFIFEGPFVSALEYATGQKAEVVGKPERNFFLSSAREFNSKPDECVMIGDVNIHNYYVIFHLERSHCFEITN